MDYLALKPCRFSGQSFRIGESVPEEMIHPGAAKNLLKMGVIAAQGTAMQTVSPNTSSSLPDTITVVIHALEGDMPLEVTRDGIQAVFDVLTSKVGEAEAIIREMTDGDALILLHISDNRKSIKEAAEGRAKELNSAKDAPEDEEGAVGTQENENATDGQEGEESEGEE